MVATERRGEERESGGRGLGLDWQALPFFPAHPQPQPETSYNAINLVPEGKIWQLSEFYMKILPLLTFFSPVSQHLSAGRGV